MKKTKATIKDGRNRKECKALNNKTFKNRIRNLDETQDFSIWEGEVRPRVIREAHGNARRALITPLSSFEPLKEKKMEKQRYYKRSENYGIFLKYFTSLMPLFSCRVATAKGRVMSTCW
jgi:hypothetical protein